MHASRRRRKATDSQNLDTGASSSAWAVSLVSLWKAVPKPLRKFVLQRPWALVVGLCLALIVFRECARYLGIAPAQRNVSNIVSDNLKRLERPDHSYARPPVSDQGEPSVHNSTGGAENSLTSFARSSQGGIDGDLLGSDAHERSFSVDDAQAAADGSFLEQLKELQAIDEGESFERPECIKDVNEKLCRKFYRVLRKYKVARVLDVSCIKTAMYMAPVLRLAAKHTYRLEYICASTHDSELEKVRDDAEMLADVGQAEVKYMNLQWWKEPFPPQVDLLVAWDMLSHAAYGRVWRFFENAVACDVKMVLFDNYVQDSNSWSPSRESINVRRAPFKFGKPTLVMKDMTSEVIQNTRQLTLYSLDALKQSLSDNPDPVQQ